MEPYQQAISDQSRTKAPVPLTDKRDGTTPLEANYNALQQQYLTFASTHDATADSAYMTQMTQQMEKSGLLPSLAIAWAEQRTEAGSWLNQSQVQQYADGKFGNDFDKAMANALLPQYDQLKHHDFWDLGGGGDRITKEDMAAKVAGIDQTTQANKALLNPNNPNAVDLPPATPNTPTAPNDTPPPSTNTPPPSCDTTTPQPTTPPPSDLLNSTTPPPSGTYKLKAGDSFWSVAQGLLNVPNDKAHANAIYKLTEQLIALNPGKDPRKFHIGDSINLPQPGQS